MQVEIQVEKYFQYKWRKIQYPLPINIVFYCLSNNIFSSFFQNLTSDQRKHDQNGWLCSEVYTSKSSKEN